MSVHELSTESWLGELETDEERKKRLRKARNRRLAAIMRIFGLIMTPLQEPAVPPPLPPVVEPDPHRRSRGGQGGSREVELAALPEAAVMDRLGRLAAATPNEAHAEAFVGALPTLAATLVPAAAPALVGAASQMASGMSSAARVLRESDQTRDLVCWLPTVARRTALRVGHQVARGHPVTPQTCTRILADTAMRVLSEAALEADTRMPQLSASARRQPRRRPAPATETKRSKTQPVRPARPSTTPSGGVAAHGRVAETRRILAAMRPPRWHRYGRTTAPIDPRLLELAKEARATQAGVSDTAFRQNNVATARVLVDGNVRYLSTGNTPGGGAHSEQWITAQIHALSHAGTRNVVLEQLYTERIPCRRTCGPFLRDRYPYAGIYYTTKAKGWAARVRELREAYGLRDWPRQQQRRRRLRIA
jgi:hypothetical protein